MPASSDYTTIKFMRGETDNIKNWQVEQGEPLLDTESGTLYYGDDDFTLNGVPINTVTAHQITGTIDLNNFKTWGRYFLVGELLNSPRLINSQGSFLIIIESSKINSDKIWQEIKVLDDPDYQNVSFNRVTLDNGVNWTDWQSGAIQRFSAVGSGATQNEKNLNKYIYTSSAFVTNFEQGPTATSSNNSGFLFTYRENESSPYVYQKLFVISGDNAGKLFHRFSRNGNVDFNNPGFNWTQIEDSSATGNRFVDIASDQTITGKKTFSQSIVGNLDGTAAKASKLSQKRQFLTNLGKTNYVEFDGSSNATSIGVTGVLPVLYGGTGVTDLSNLTVGKFLTTNK